MEAKLKEATDGDQSLQFVQIALDDIDPSPFQTRKTFQTADLEQSIKENGFLGAILVRPGGRRFQIVYGERRYRSMQNLKKKKIPCIIKDLTDQQAHQMLLIENLQREGLDPFEEADGLARLKRDFKLSLNDMADRLGKPRSIIGQMITRAETPEELKRIYHETRDNQEWQFKLTHIDLILRQPVEGDRLAIARWCRNSHASTRTLENYLNWNYRLALSAAFFDVKDDTLMRPACVDCPKRIINKREKGKADASGDTCLDPGCYHFKNDQQLVKLAVAEGCLAMPLKEAMNIIDSDGSISYMSRTLWMLLNEKCYQDNPRRRTFAQLIKGSNVKRYLLAHSKHKKIVIASKRSDVQAHLLKVHSIKLTSDERPKPTTADLEKRDHKKAKKLAWMEVAEKVAEAAHQLKPIPPEHWPFMWDRFRYYDWTNSINTAINRRGLVLPELDDDHNDLGDRLKAMAAQMPPRQQASLYYEIVWLQEGKHWWEWNDDKPSSRAIELAAKLLINPVEVYKEHLGAIRERKRQRKEAEARRAQRGATDGGNNGKKRLPKRATAAAGN